MTTALHRLLYAALLVAASLLLVLSLPGCGGGGDEPEACGFDTVRLDDGRVVPAPNNCPPGSTS